MDFENKKGRLWAFQWMGWMSKTKTKEITTAYLNIRKYRMEAIEISKLPQANCLGAEIDVTCKRFREQCRFFSWRKIRGGEKSPVYVKSEICVLTSFWGLASKKRYQQNKVIWEFAAIFSFILVIPKHHLLVRQVPYHKFCLKCLCLREKTKVKKVKSDKKRIVCGFHFKEHHFKRESDCETLRISGRFETKG